MSPLFLRSSEGGSGGWVYRGLGRTSAKSVHDLSRLNAVKPLGDSIGQLRWLAIEYEPASRKANKARAIMPSQIQRMEIAEDSDAVSSVDAAQGIHDDPRIAWIKRRHRLIGQYDLGLLNQGTGDGDALLLSAGEPFGPLRRVTCHIKHFECGERDRAVLVGPEAQQSAMGRHLIQPADQHIR